MKFRVASGRLATKEEIIRDFNSIQKQPKGRVAEYYKRFVELHISNSDIDTLTKNHINSFQKELIKVFPEYPTFPNEAKMALLDLIFNVGMTNLNTQWPRLKKAVLNQNWEKAAQESNRKYPIPPERNNYVKNLFEKAAKKNQTLN
ncbi:hypothetical protein MSP8887_01048 [Marinomonas spartinae]|uniref:hypothetical protein n=1 Tax=Marinomonas spartinae TaxID=1792290 RepID=UPI000808E3A8|nr:hypothetical protein [Marinomonas spartinae]SBS29330.1 hypothetical protein MSP8887_01048 [Marinomonas spartinae]